MRKRALPFPRLRGRTPASIRSSLLLPLTGLGLAVMALLSLSIWIQVDRFESRSVQARSEITARAIGSASESLGTAGELQRMVAALGAEPGVELILIATGDPPGIIASTRGVLKGKLLSQLPASPTRAALLHALEKGEQRSFAIDGEGVGVVMPLLLTAQTSGGGNLRAAAVAVHQTDAVAQDDLQELGLLLVVASIAAVLALMLVGRSLIQRHVVEPLRAVEQFIQTAGDDTLSPRGGARWAESSGTLHRMIEGDRSDFRVMIAREISDENEFGRLARVMRIAFEQIRNQAR
jgi:hypothetical protein